MTRSSGTTRSTGDLDNWVQRCYRNKACTFDITPRFRVVLATQASSSGEQMPMLARLLEASEFEDTDIAVLKVEGPNMATVALADIAQAVSPGDEVMALGFPGSELGTPAGIIEPSQTFGRVSSVRVAAGTTRDIQADLTSRAV